MSVVVVELQQTCGACPSQWEGRTEDGRHVYIRYRFGLLTAGVDADEWGAVRSAEEVGISGPAYEGEMETGEMIDRVSRNLGWEFRTSRILDDPQ